MDTVPSRLSTVMYTRVHCDVVPVYDGMDRVSGTLQ
jgi:hypothetical protein